MKGLAVVTGGKRGIGTATAESMAARGYEATIVSRSRERAPAFIESDAAKGLTGRYYERFKEKNLEPVALDAVFNEGLRSQAMRTCSGQ